MLDSPDQIPWGTLHHAYGTAEDIPEKLLALTSDNPESREWARSMLEMGALHQGSIYTATPYVARVLIELVQREATPDKGWIYSYLSRLHSRAQFWLTHRVDEVNAALYEIEADNPEIAQQILYEIEPHKVLFLEALESFDPKIRLFIVPTLVQWAATMPVIGERLMGQFLHEETESVKNALALALGMTITAETESVLETLLNNEDESVTRRLAVGLGWIIAHQQDTPDDILRQCADLMHGNWRPALVTLNGIRYNVFNQGEILEGLYHLSPDQKMLFVPPLLYNYRQLPFDAGLKSRAYGYLLSALIMLAFDDILPAAATITDLTPVERSILEAFQELDVPNITAKNAWNVWHSEDFRTLLGLDVKDESGFNAFMAGERGVREPGSNFDQHMIQYWGKQNRKLGY
jgi:hypothetical protein